MAKQTARSIVFDDPQKDLDKLAVLLIFEQPSRLAKQRRQMWRLPGGKCCDHPNVACLCPELARETAARETLEETGLQVSVTRRVHLHVYPESGVETYFFLVQIDGGVIKKRLFGRQKIETPQWFPVRELPENMNIHHRNAIEKAIFQEHGLKQPRSEAAIPS